MPTTYDIKKQAGFTLIELAIVLVIIGLIVGGVVAGQGLIESSKVSANISAMNQIKQAVLSFRLKHNQLPGDMKNATSFWGLADPTQAACDLSYAASTNVPSGTQTCNGDGDGFIEIDNDVGGYSNEILRMWQHMANSDIYPSTYNGVPSGTAPRVYASVSSVNTPPIPSEKGSIFVFYCDNNIWSDAVRYCGKDLRRNIIAMGRDLNNEGSFLPVFSTQFTHAMDLKIDDGLPRKGILTATTGYSGPSSNCTSTDTTSASYSLDSSINQACMIFIDAGF